jgi:hypothetical protein
MRERERESNSMAHRSERVLAQHFSARRHELTVTAEDLVNLLCVRCLQVCRVSQKLEHVPIFQHSNLR